jgi:hypothetical protein
MFFILGNPYKKANTVISHLCYPVFLFLLHASPLVSWQGLFYPILIYHLFL